ncbi:MAG TPA: PQQ-binding-like beta-propeller repeat protein [Thermoanaerobaculia bacterium]
MLAALAGVARLPAQTDWLQFGFDARHSGVNPSEGQITAANVANLRAIFAISLPAVADGAPAYLSGVSTAGGLRDLLFVTTKDGRLIAVDALSGATVWSRQPASGPGFTTSSPAIDPDRQFVYSYGLDGRVHKYGVGDGSEVSDGGWPEVATLKPGVEKGSSALAIATLGDGSAVLYVANGGYPGDAGDYQGHITAIQLATGAQQVFNTDCSDQPVHFITGGSPDCRSVQSAVWARPGVIYDAELDEIFIATGNGSFDAGQGGHDWGDSVLALHPDGTGSGGAPLDSYTPADFQFLDSHDADLGSTAPALLPSPAPDIHPHLAVQGGKDGELRLLDLDDLSGQGGPGRVGGELQRIGVPQGGEVLTQPAIWANPADGSSWAFVANDAGIAGIQLQIDNGTPSLVPRWTQHAGGTSPIVANGILFYAGGPGIQALDLLDGSVLWSDKMPSGLHWESPIVVNGRLYVTDNTAHLIAYAPATGQPRPCKADATSLCLLNGRFAVGVTWSNQYNGTAGSGHAVPSTGSSGFFYFTDPANDELIVKMLAFGNGFKFFYGQLTDLHFTITVTDSLTGKSKQYQNNAGNCGAIDESAFTAKRSRQMEAGTATGRCIADAHTLCLLRGSLAVKVAWQNQFNGTGGTGMAFRLSDEAGRFSFTDPSDVELVLKALDFGRHIKFFYGTLSDLGYVITVTKIATGAVKTYTNPPGTYCGGIDDDAF